MALQGWLFLRGAVRPGSFSVSMSQYQKPSRIATPSPAGDAAHSWGAQQRVHEAASQCIPQNGAHPSVGQQHVFRLCFLALCLLSLVAGEGIWQISPALNAAVVPVSARAGDRQAALENATAPLFLLPLGDTSVALLTHTVDVRVTVESDMTLRMEVSASYRVHNPEQTETTLLMQVAPAPDASGDQLPTRVNLQSQGQELLLEPPSTSYPKTAQLVLGPDARQTLVLNYLLVAPRGESVGLRYPISAVTEWPGRLGSWRLTLDFSGDVNFLTAPETWLVVGPEGWTYTGRRLQWLSEEPPPVEPIQWQILHPRLTQEIRSIQERLNQEASLPLFQQLGDLYARIYRSPQVQPASRERFYAQALAIYAEGVAFAEDSGSTGPELGGLHRGLASLYRSRSIRQDGSVDPEYVEAMVEEASLAASLLPGASPDREEALAWLAEGLWQLLRDAQKRRDWLAADKHLTQLATLPPAYVDPQRLDQERRLVVLEQAQQLLEQGEAETAAALVAGLVQTDVLEPDTLDKALFTSWQVSLTIRPDTLDVDAVGRVAEGRVAQVQSEVDLLAQAWQETASGSSPEIQVVDNKVLLTFHGVDLKTRLRLAQAMPGSAHWALIRLLLLNSDAATQRQGRLLWRQVTIQQQMDLRSIADQWEAIAAGLERMAAETETASDVLDPEARLQRQLSAFAYRQEARRWHNLVQNSSVQVDVFASNGQREPARTWVLQLTDPPQILRVQSEVLAMDRLLLGALLLLAAIFAFAGILWFLL